MTVKRILQRAIQQHGENTPAIVRPWDLEHQKGFVLTVFSKLGEAEYDLPLTSAPVPKRMALGLLYLFLQQHRKASKN